MTNQNIVLIGMPGAGKSTIGVLLAKETAFDFVDTDVLIQVRQGKMLQQILDESGYLSLREIEQQVLLELELSRHIVATGGSAVYSDAGMANLMQQGLVVFWSDLDGPVVACQRGLDLAPFLVEDGEVEVG